MFPGDDFRVKLSLPLAATSAWIFFKQVEIIQFRNLSGFRRMDFNSQESRTFSCYNSYSEQLLIYRILICGSHLVWLNSSSDFILFFVNPVANGTIGQKKITIRNHSHFCRVSLSLMKSLLLVKLLDHNFSLKIKDFSLLSISQISNIRELWPFLGNLIGWYIFPSTNPIQVLIIFASN